MGFQDPADHDRRAEISTFDVNRYSGFSHGNERLFFLFQDFHPGVVPAMGADTMGHFWLLAV